MSRLLNFYEKYLKGLGFSICCAPFNWTLVCSSFECDNGVYGYEIQIGPFSLAVIW